MADHIPLKLNPTGSGAATLAEFGVGDTVPISQGGTGGTTQLTSQAALGLVKQTAADDATAGSLMAVGAFGLGGNAVSLAGAAADCNAIEQSGFFYLTNPLDAPDASDGWLLNEVLSSIYATQAFVRVLDGKQFTRSKLNGVWSVWDAVVTAQTLTAAMVGGFKNRVINGGCSVAQYNASSSYGSGFGSVTAWDRWMAVNGSAGGAFIQQRSSLSFGGVAKTACNQTVTTVAQDLSTTKYWSGFSHRFEGFNVYDLLGKSVTISFLFCASVAGTYSFALVDGAQTNSYVTTFTVSASVVTKVIITIPSMPTTLGIPNSNAVGLYMYIGAQNAVTYSTATLNAWQSGVKLTSPTATLWSITTGASIWCTELQMEVGSVATPFESRPISVELNLCFRYFYNLPGGQQIAVSSAGQTSTAFIIPLPEFMRVIPTITHNLTDANYVGTGPGGTQWVLESSNLAYATKTGTISSLFSVGANCKFVTGNLFGMTWGVATAPNLMVTGSSCNFIFNAEL